VQNWGVQGSAVFLLQNNRTERTFVHLRLRSRTTPVYERIFDIWLFHVGKTCSELLGAMCRSPCLPLHLCVLLRSRAPKVYDSIWIWALLQTEPKVLRVIISKLHTHNTHTPSFTKKSHRNRALGLKNGVLHPVQTQGAVVLATTCI